MPHIGGKKRWMVLGAKKQLMDKCITAGAVRYVILMIKIGQLKIFKTLVGLLYGIIVSITQNWLTC